MTTKEHHTATVSAQIEFDGDLLQRYDRSGPRYTSYPTALEFDGAFDASRYRHHTDSVAGEPTRRPLSLYFHLPFCASVCYYCACNKIITANRSRSVPYLEHLEREIALQAECFSDQRPVRQLHWGGGTPTYLDHAQMDRLMAAIRRHFTLEPDEQGEYSIEVDPRETRDDTMPVLRELGFNRLSLGVQDFDPKVQRAVNRIQSETLTLGVMADARAVGFRSINVDLIYGLPQQTPTTFARTVERIIAADPDRISIFNYAHLPERFKVQRQIDASALPSAGEKLAILEQSIAQLTAAGYCYIGMDHFAKPDDELARAQRDGQLHRNFQGYATHGDCHLIGMGVTAIGAVGDCYYQNAREPDAYYAQLDKGRLPIERGIELDADDRLRRYVIGELICHFEVSVAAVEARYGIDFASYFSSELRRLAPMCDDGLVTVAPEHLAVTARGRLLIRNVCMVFDRYLAQTAPARFSRVI